MEKKMSQAALSILQQQKHYLLLKYLNEKKNTISHLSKQLLSSTSLPKFPSVLSKNNNNKTHNNHTY